MKQSLSAFRTELNVSTIRTGLNHLHETITKHY
jgi:hypothetical protein